MLKRAWYLTNTDFFGDMRSTPQPPVDDVLGKLTAVFGEDGGFSPAHTAAATYIALVMAEHVAEAIAHPAESLRDHRELSRLLCGLNVLTAHLAQSVQRLAYHIDQGNISGLAEAADPVTVSLVKCGATCEMVAGYLKEAHLRVQLASHPGRTSYQVTGDGR